MRIRVPDYYDDFRCLAGACPHTCCEKWEVVLDPETVRRYKTVPGPLGEKLRAAMEADAEGDVCFPLRGGRCPFLDEENLCEIHRQLGEAATSVTCRTHPRFTEDYGPFREVSLCASCPAALELLLGTDAPLTFPETETAEPEEPGDPWLTGLVPLRERMLRELADRRRPLEERLTRFLLLALEGQALLEEDRAEDLAALAAEREEPQVELPDGPGLFPQVLRALAELEVLDGDWRDLLGRGETAAPVPVPEPLLERVAVYFAFRWLLKAVNDGDLLGRAQLCVLLTLTARHLAGVCGFGEAVRRLCSEIEHSDENLEALLDAFRAREALSLAAFLRTLAEG